MSADREAPPAARRLIDTIGLPTPAQARRLLVLLGLAGGHPAHVSEAEIAKPVKTAA